MVVVVVVVVSTFPSPHRRCFAPTVNVKSVVASTPPQSPPEPQLQHLSTAASDPLTQLAGLEDGVGHLFLLPGSDEGLTGEDLGLAGIVFFGVDHDRAGATRPAEDTNSHGRDEQFQRTTLLSLLHAGHSLSEEPT